VAALHGQRIVEVALGYGSHIAALTDYQRVYTWGKGTDAQLGHSVGEEFVPEPVHLEALDGRAICSVAVGESHSAALSSSGEVFTWGSSIHGQLGHGTHEQQPIPKKVAPLEDGSLIKAIALGPSLTAVLDSEGSVWVCGGSYDPSQGVQATLRLVAAFQGSRVLRLACGVYHMLVQLQGGHIMVWRGQEDPQTLEHVVLAPEHTSDVLAVSLSCGSGHNSVLNGRGELFTWGRDNFGQLGHGSAIGGNIHDGIVPIEAFRHRKVAFAHCGEFHTAAIVEAKLQSRARD